MVPYECCALLEVMPKSGRRDLYTVPELSGDEQVGLRARLTALLHMMADDHENGPSASDANGETDTQQAPSAPERGNRMHLAIPVIGLNQIIGVLFVEESSEPSC
jgi:hypothetical protein